MITLRLYTTLGCHLCSQLEALLATLCAGEYRLERVEISEDDALMARYGVRIPVLADAEVTIVSSSFDGPLLGLLGISDKVDVAFVAKAFKLSTCSSLLLILLSK